ncbi:hypothetical protein RND71_011707 [Anisodus tanguticus]|uniref:AMP-activated protein kinase glycogen-binding domain-containing protein n=1 Tax=Anisodus tanguticus TaxID=243964 RepID=A0AAE1VQ26_9SOLA|nr:hypothetical protein RND71_011707 [Anisodus tanguticus]
MECNLLNSLGQTNFPRFKVEKIDGVRGDMASYNSRIGFHRMHKSFSAPNWKYNIPCTSWKVSCAPENLEEEFSVAVSENIAEAGESDPEALPEEVPERPLRSNELKLLLADAERSKLLKKLSEANRYNRLLKRERRDTCPSAEGLSETAALPTKVELQAKEDALVNFKSELSVVELELQVLVRLAEEISKSAIPAGSRKVNGRYIQSHLFSRLEAIREKLKEQIKDVEAVQAKEVPLSWVGVAESVQVMGSFDGWSQGEQLSPEYTGSYMHFSATLFLRPGRYEIKFLIDGDWQLSPELPTTGEGLTKNNLLVVE